MASSHVPPAPWTLCALTCFFREIYVKTDRQRVSLLSTSGLSVYMLTDMDRRDFKSASLHTHTNMLPLSFCCRETLLTLWEVSLVDAMHIQTSYNKWHVCLLCSFHVPAGYFISLLPVNDVHSDSGLYKEGQSLSVWSLHEHYFNKIILFWKYQWCDQAFLEHSRTDPEPVLTSTLFWTEILFHLKMRSFMCACTKYISYVLV